jgi:hypothetical protein
MGNFKEKSIWDSGFSNCFSSFFVSKNVKSISVRYGSFSKIIEGPQVRTKWVQDPFNIHTVPRG